MKTNTTTRPSVTNKFFASWWKPVWDGPTKSEEGPAKPRSGVAPVPHFPREPEWMAGKKWCQACFGYHKPDEHWPRLNTEGDE